MALTIITGVPGTGKTALLVAELEKIAATGRKIFVDNIPGLTIEHYRAGKVTEWHRGTWLHIDQYKRTSPSVAMPVDIVEDDGDGNENWQPNPEVVKDKDGNFHRLALDEAGQVVGSVPYESHKGALLVIDEAQRHFRPRPAGSAVPDHVAALEVHRHQGLDIWLVTQRPGLLDSNVRALCGKHIALRSTPFGRYKYEWPEVGDIESKTSRDTAAKSRYKLPKHVFKLYKSAEAHTEHKHTLPMVAKALFVIVPLCAFLLFSSYKMISGKFQSIKPAQAEPVRQQQGGKIQQARVASPPQVAPVTVNEIIDHHPFENLQFSIVARLKSATKDLFRFSASENGQHAFFISNAELQEAGYSVSPIGDCSVKLAYKTVQFYVTCDIAGQSYSQYQPPPQQIAQQGIRLQP